MPLFGYKRSAVTPVDEIAALTERHNSNAATQSYITDKVKRLAADLRAVSDEYDEIVVITQTKIDALYELQTEAENASDEARSQADDVHYSIN